MTKNEAIDYWLKGAEEDLRVAEGLFDLGHYHYCLFFGHLVLEKALKALIVKKRKQTPPPVHGLPLLAQKTGVKFTSEQLADLAEITKFNVRARYNDYKRKFYKQATKEFTRQWFKKIKQLLVWLKKQI